MPMKVDRLVSLIIAIAWVGASLALGHDDGKGSPQDRIVTLGFALVALILNWFGDEPGRFTGWTGRGYISRESPG
jgi:hypothetical protein